MKSELFSSFRIDVYNRAVAPFSIFTVRSDGFNLGDWKSSAGEKEQPAFQVAMAECGVRAEPKEEQHAASAEINWRHKVVGLYRCHEGGHDNKEQGQR